MNTGLKKAALHTFHYCTQAERERERAHTLKVNTSADKYSTYQNSWLSVLDIFLSDCLLVASFEF